MPIRKIFSLLFCLLFFMSKCSVAQQPKLILPIGHTSYLNSAEFSPDSKRIVTTSKSEIKVWDVLTGKLLANLEGHRLSVKYAQFSPDGKKIISASSDSTARIWDAATGNLLHILKGPDAIKYSSFSTDSKWISTNGYKECRLWDASTGLMTAELKGIGFGINAANFSADSKRIVTASSWVTQVWNTDSGQLLTSVKAEKFSFNHAQFSADRTKIVTASADKKVKILDAVTGAIITDIAAHERAVLFANFSPDGNSVISTSENGAVRISDVKSGKSVAYLSGHKTNVYTALFSPDGQSIVTASEDGTAKVWDFKTAKLLYSIQAYLKENGTAVFSKVFSAKFSPDGKKIVTTSMDHSAKIWDTGSGNLSSSLIGHSRQINSSHYSNDGKWIITAEDRTASLWNVNSGVLFLQLNGHTDRIIDAVFSEDLQKILTCSEDGTAKIWNAGNGSLLLDLKDEGINAAAFSADGKRIITESYQHVLIWNAIDGSLLADFSWDLSYSISPDGNKIVTVHRGHGATLWDVFSGKHIADLKGHSSYVEKALFSHDSRLVVTISEDSTAKIWNAISGSLLIDISENNPLSSVAFSRTEKKMAIGLNNGNVKIRNSDNGQLISTFKPHTARVFFLSFSSDGGRLLSISDDNTISVLDSQNGSGLLNISRQKSDNQLPFFSPDGKYLVISSKGKLVNVWDLKTRKSVNGASVDDNGFVRAVNYQAGKVLAVNNSEMCQYSLAGGGKINSIIGLDSTGYLNRVPSGYFMCSQNGSKLLHYVTKELKVITFEQLDVKYNRPDKVLEAIGNTDTALIKSYRKAYEKRIKKLGIDTTAFRDGYSVPEADFANRDKIEFEQTSEKLKLDIKSLDSTYKLDRFNIWINEIPLYGQRGINLRKKNKNNFDSTITIKLSQGENKIETSISNVNGTESYRMPLEVIYTPAVKQKEQTYFIGIGIDQFNESKYNLKYSTKDIRDLSKKLKEKYNDIIIDTLFNENVTISNVKALKQKLLQTSVNDKVIISYSGHGLLSKEYDYYLSTYAVNFEKPEQNGLPYDELENLLDSIPARKKLMLIDACHSGEVDKEEGIAMNKTADSLGLAKGIIIKNKNQPQLGLKNSFELMQSLFVNVGKSTGATIISAAAGNQFALERGDLKNGVFTFAILEAMKNHSTIKISELKKIVGERVEQLTNGMQKPTSRNETIAVDWNVW